MKNFTVVRLSPSSPYEEVFAHFYQEHNLDALPYEEAVFTYGRLGLLVPGSWSRSMTQLGNCSIDIIPDCLPLQRKWAEENGVDVDFSKPGWQIPLFFQQLEKIRPDVLFLYAGGWWFLPDTLRKELKSRFPFLKVVSGFWSDTFATGEDYTKFAGIDLLFCGYEYIVQDAQKAGIRAVQHGSCFDPLISETLAHEPTTPTHDFIFAGSSGYGFVNHQNRYHALRELVEKTGIKIWCYEPEQKHYPVRYAIRNALTNSLALLPQATLDHLFTALSLPQKSTRALDSLVNAFIGNGRSNRLFRLIEEARKPRSERYQTWDISLKPLSTLYPQNCFRPKFALDYFRLIRDSRLIFNRHTDEDNHAGNIRMFEVTGIGSCLLSDKPEESKKLFDIDSEIVTYSSIDECIEKARTLLSNEPLRAQIAAKGRARTLKDHTVMNRCQAIHHDLQPFL